MPSLTDHHASSTLPRKLLEKFYINPNGCWTWTGAKNSTGYGNVWWKGSSSTAHVLIFVLLRGRGLGVNEELDHLCRNRDCVNPDHLEVVSHKENVLRGNSPSAINAIRTSCKNGHPFTAENTRVTVRGWRQCRTCAGWKGGNYAQLG